MKRYPTRITALASLLCLAACGSLPTAPRQALYLTVVDAGSSGSRAHLYKLAPAGGFIEIEDMAEVEPTGLKALSTFEGDALQAGPQGIRPLLDAVAETLAKSGIPKSWVRVDVLATAGMRLVEQGNAMAARAIYASVRDTIAASGYQPGGVETISGENEGLYAWVDVNYLYRNFQQGSATRGIVEVGGASAQVAYAASDAGHPKVRTHVINGRSYPVLSVSYLGLGQNEARKAMIGIAGTSDNACYPDKGSRSAPASFNADTVNPSYAIASGAYRHADCDGLYRSVLNDYGVKKTAIAGGFDSTDFIGMSSIYHAMHGWGVLEQPAMLGSRVEANCSGSDAWSLKVAPMQKGTSKFAQNACANGTYLNALLFNPVSGLGLRGDRVKAVEKINGLAPTWTRGYAVLQGGQ
jgi:hypothetical protein